MVDAGIDENMTECDTLFLLPPGFFDNDRREYCPECAEMWGLLHYYPALKETVEINYQPITRPREQMIALLGEAHQNCPTLVLCENAPDAPGITAKRANGRRFFENARDIGAYYAEIYGTAFPRGR
ncbi:MAG: DUF3088 family protein [Parvularculaceae bacterium]